uniref:Uncharacterized protein AlNc14C2G295 n=1 Tax=Albugo laibachii Nc14 TaxID=890382 RepID=F0VZF7_9STRA|nr:conserved hypothetical protein [Albugo laibachii Nc14]|eukprot:CCA14187.1 conserved hypothetical protein [Albugo laibachii Nc14]
MLSDTWSHGSKEKTSADDSTQESVQSESKVFANIVAAFLNGQQVMCKHERDELNLKREHLENVRIAMQTTMMHDAMRCSSSRDKHQVQNETVKMQNAENLQLLHELIAEKATRKKCDRKLNENEQESLAMKHQMDDILKESSQIQLENEYLTSKLLVVEQENSIKEEKLKELELKLETQEKSAYEKLDMQKAEWLVASNDERSDAPSEPLTQEKLLQMPTDRSYSDLQDLLHQKSLELVDQSEKNIAMSAKLRVLKQVQQSLLYDVEKARLVLLQGIKSNVDVDASMYKHVTLEELLRLRFQNSEYGRSLPTCSIVEDGNSMTTHKAEKKITETGESPRTYLPHVQPFSVMDTSGKGSRLESEVQLLRSRYKRILELKEKADLDLERALLKVDALQGIKEKYTIISTRDQSRKEVRMNLESQLKETNDKLLALSQHTEKLMLHTNQEAIAKSKLLKSSKSLRNEHRELVLAHTKLQHEYHTQSKTLQVFMEESQLMRDQLQLMDQKVAEMGHKMDWLRSSTQKELKSAHQERDILRAKLLPESVLEFPKTQSVNNAMLRTHSSISSRTPLATADNILNHGRHSYRQKLLDKDANLTSRRYMHIEKSFAIGKSHYGLAKLSNDSVE